jgi:DNA-binding transcriptional ArsR family regulator
LTAQRDSKTKTTKARQTHEVKVDPKMVRALGHPLRMNALAILNERIASPNEIANELGEGLSQVSYHIKVLRECEFIELVKTKQRRGAVEHYYRATRRALMPDDLLRDLPSGTQVEIIGNALRELIEDSTASLRDGTFNRRDDYHVSQTPLVLDEEAWQGATALLAETLQRLFDLQAESCERLAANGEKGISATVGLVGFESSRGLKDSETANP